MAGDYEKEKEMLLLKKEVAQIEEKAAMLKMFAAALETPFVQNILAKMELENTTKKGKK